MSHKTTSPAGNSGSSGGNNRPDPPVTPLDVDCASFVRDALFPLRRDWATGRHHHQHSKIHPALEALDKLRTTLIESRPATASYSGLFPRGVLLVPRTEAVAPHRGSGGSSGSKRSNTTTMEYNGQPDVDEKTASLEVLPNLLTVRCTTCLNNASVPPSAKAVVRKKPLPAWKNEQDATEYELVVCSDRVLQKDYYQKYGRQKASSAKGREGQRREDLPMRSMKVVEETLARELTKLQVNPEEAAAAPSAKAPKASSAPLEYPAFPSPSDLDRDVDAAEASCETFARLELLAARAAECGLVTHTEGSTEVRVGSALRPQSVFAWLPSKVQNRFVDRCAFAEANRNTRNAARRVASADPAGRDPPFRPRVCVWKAWAGLQEEQQQQEQLEAASASDSR